MDPLIENKRGRKTAVRQAAVTLLHLLFLNENINIKILTYIMYIVHRSRIRAYGLDSNFLFGVLP